MKRFLAVAVALFVVATLATASLVWAADVQGKIQKVDSSGKWVTLDTGIMLMIPASVQVDRAALKPGTDVKVSYETQGSDHIVTAIDLHPPAK